MSIKRNYSITNSLLLENMKTIFLILVSLYLFGCKKENSNLNENKNIQTSTVKNPAPINIPDFKKIFSEAKLNGCFVLHDLKNDKYFYYDSLRCNKEFIPASTFKIPNSLFSLEAGAVKDENEKLKWDGKDRNRPEWNQDTDMRMAFKNSTVWFYQECARRIGEKRMQHFVDTLNYGNKNIGGGIDRFWLDGAIRITAMQQIDLLKRIYDNKVPFSQRNIDILKNIMIMEKNDDYTLRAKTGTAPDSKGTGVAWYVGYITNKDNTYFFALNIDIGEDAMLVERIALAKRVFNEAGIAKFEVK